MGDGYDEFLDVIADRDIVLEPVKDVVVTQIAVTCGMCEASIEIDIDGLDYERGGVELEHSFDACGECGQPFDASRVEFNAGINIEVQADDAKRISAALQRMGWLVPSSILEKAIHAMEPKA